MLFEFERLLLVQAVATTQVVLSKAMVASLINTRDLSPNQEISHRIDLFVVLKPGTMAGVGHLKYLRLRPRGFHAFYRFGNNEFRLHAPQQKHRAGDQCKYNG